jgi:hypothetical protein
MKSVCLHGTLVLCQPSIDRLVGQVVNLSKDRMPSCPTYQTNIDRVLEGKPSCPRISSCPRSIEPPPSHVASKKHPYWWGFCFWWPRTLSPMIRIRRQRSYKANTSPKSSNWPSGARRTGWPTRPGKHAMYSRQLTRTSSTCRCCRIRLGPASVCSPLLPGEGQGVRALEVVSGQWPVAKEKPSTITRLSKIPLIRIPNP